MLDALELLLFHKFLKGEPFVLGLKPTQHLLQKSQDLALSFWLVFPDVFVRECDWRLHAELSPRHACRVSKYAWQVEQVSREQVLNTVKIDDRQVFWRILGRKQDFRQMRNLVRRHFDSYSRVALR